MGKQQQLIAIAASVLLAVAAVLAFNLFESEESNREAVRMDIENIADASRNWYRKPGVIGGGGGSFSGMTFEDLNISFEEIGGANNTTAVNENGRFIIDTSADSVLTVTAHPSKDADYTNGLEGESAGVPIYTLVCKDDIAWGEVSVPSECDQ